MCLRLIGSVFLTSALLLVQIGAAHAGSTTSTCKETARGIAENWVDKGEASNNEPAKRDANKLSYLAVKGKNKKLASRAQAIKDEARDRNSKVRLVWALNASILSENYEGMRILINNGADVDGVQQPRETADQPILTAAQCGDKRALDILVQSGADVNARGRDETDALWASILRHNESSAEFLLDNGFKPCENNILKNGDGERLSRAEVARRLGSFSENFVDDVSC